MTENKLTHFDEHGQAVMVDVSGKPETHRTAIASGIINVSPPFLQAISEGTAAKGDVLGVARIAQKHQLGHSPVPSPAHCQVQREL